MSSQGRIILLDGPSASGKSRLKREVLASCPDLHFCRRVTTRPRRDGESDQDYDFVTTDQFQEMESRGELAAWRHFQFGMSYGLPTGPVEKVLASGKTAFCLIDLGSVEQAKAHWPDAYAVLLHAPLEQLRQRLMERGGHTPEQIEERLANAEKVWSKRHLYDRVLVNENGRWEQTLQEMLAICRRSTK